MADAQDVQSEDLARYDDFYRHLSPEVWAEWKAVSRENQGN